MSFKFVGPSIHPQKTKTNSGSVLAPGSQHLMYFCFDNVENLTNLKLSKSENQLHFCMIFKIKRALLCFWLLNQFFITPGLIPNTTNPKHTYIQPKPSALQNIITKMLKTMRNSFLRGGKLINLNPLYNMKKKKIIFVSHYNHP